MRAFDFVKIHTYVSMLTSVHVVSVTVCFFICIYDDCVSYRAAHVCCLLLLLAAAAAAVSCCWPMSYLVRCQPVRAVDA